MPEGLKETGSIFHPDPRKPVAAAETLFDLTTTPERVTTLRIYDDGKPASMTMSNEQLLIFIQMLTRHSNMDGFEGADGSVN